MLRQWDTLTLTSHIVTFPFQTKDTESYHHQCSDLIGAAVQVDVGLGGSLVCIMKGKVCLVTLEKIFSGSCV